LTKAESLLADWSKETSRPDGNRVDVVLAVDDLVTAVKTLIDDGWEHGYLAAITGIDLGVEAGDIEVLYHFCSGPAILTLRARTPRDNAVVPTVCDLIPSASFYERELIEMLGVTVTGTPNTDRLFLPDEWPEGVYPLREDFVMQK
jgi:NADH:ubiquinone oxidoreductase subunit C